MGIARCIAMGAWYSRVFVPIISPFTLVALLFTIANEDQARRLRTKAEGACLVTNSLKVRPHLESLVEFEES